MKDKQKSGKRPKRIKRLTNMKDSKEVFRRNFLRRKHYKQKDGGKNGL